MIPPNNRTLSHSDGRGQGEGLILKLDESIAKLADRQGRLMFGSVGQAVPASRSQAGVGTERNWGLRPLFCRVLADFAFDPPAATAVGDQRSHRQFTQFEFRRSDRLADDCLQAASVNCKIEISST